MFIQVEQTPNPNTLKFIPEEPLFEGAYTLNITSSKEALQSKLGEALFNEDNIQSVFITKDFISITTDNYELWDLLKPRIISKIIEHVENNIPIIESLKTTQNNFTPKEEDKELVDNIISLIEDRVRPALAMDGGDVLFHSYEDGIVYLQMQGSCRGCPSAVLTLKHGIENMLKYYFPEIKGVEEVE